MGIFVLKILVAAVGDITYQSESKIAAKLLLLLRTCYYRIIALPLSSLTKSYSRPHQVFFWRLLTSLAFALVQVLNLRFFSSRIRFQFCIRVSRGYMIPSTRLSIRPPKSTEPSEPKLLSASSKSG